MKKQNEYIPALEALLFISGDEGLSIDEIKNLLNIQADQACALIDSLKKSYEENMMCGLTLIETAKCYKLATKQEFAPLIEKFAQSSYSRHLTSAMLETLTIIAYKQPITRMEIEEIRGVQVSNNLKKLRIRNLIEEAGRLEQPGRPVLYRTTTTFLDYFGLNDLSELPALEDTPSSEPTSLFYDHFYKGDSQEEA
ncbi:SMC-Scp complex subunit ScpB [Allofustis seminis]|uniref:SMC-Scp complex subunit ScpB n=1 Tax=Allofustis seminis TaxID=166939 RepID=UPI00035C7A25|nr:SMC-Scp complex subunit ScpB [Allofustis seminis]